MALAALFMLASPVLAQSLCGPRDAFIDKLKNDYAETPFAHGLINSNDMLIEVFASKNGETWTLLLTYPNGESCLITAGKNWRAVAPQLLKPMGQPI